MLKKISCFISQVHTKAHNYSETLQVILDLKKQSKKDNCTKFTCLVIFTQHLKKIRTQIYLQDSLIYICKFCYGT